MARAILAGLTVIDVTQNVAGLCCSQILGSLGATDALHEFRDAAWQLCADSSGDSWRSVSSAPSHGAERCRMAASPPMPTPS